MQQVLVVYWLDSRITKHRSPSWANFADMRTKYDRNKKVRDTAVEWDI